MTRGGKSSRGEGPSCRAEEDEVCDDLQRRVSTGASALTTQAAQSMHDNTERPTSSRLDPTATCGCANARRLCAAHHPDPFPFPFPFPCPCPCLCLCSRACQERGSGFSAGCAYHGGHNHHRCHVDGFCRRLRRRCGWSDAPSTERRRPFGAGTGRQLAQQENSFDSACSGCSPYFFACKPTVRRKRHPQQAQGGPLASRRGDAQSTMGRACITPSSHPSK